MDWNTPNLTELLATIWQRWRQGTARRDDAWHVAAVATVFNGCPAVRKIVLRSVDAATRSLVFFSDSRANKIAHLLERPRLEWLFYDSVARIQVRAQATAVVHNQNPVTEAVWNAKPDLNYLHYLSLLAPGTSLPAFLPAEAELVPEHEMAFRNFAVVVTTVEQIDWLALLPGDTHKRAAFNWTGERFEGRWVVP